MHQQLILLSCSPSNEKGNKGGCRPSIYGPITIFVLSSKRCRKTGAITHVVAEVLSRLSGCVTDSIIALGMEVLSSAQEEETQTFGQTAVPACGGPHIFIYASACRSVGGRMCRTSLSPNMELSEHLSWSYQACVDMGPFGGLVVKKLYNHVEDGLVSTTGGEHYSKNRNAREPLFLFPRGFCLCGKSWK